MKPVRMVKSIPLFVVVLLVIATLYSDVLAQRAPTSIQRRVDELNRQGEQYERDQLKADLKGRPNKPDDRKRSQSVAAEVGQDFKDLQERYNQIVLAMAAKTGFVYGSVSEAIDEISKCSTRLKHNLALPKPDDSPEKRRSAEDDSEPIDKLLLTLRKHIYSFVTNPLFESQGVLNVDQAKSASNDLERIIELTKALRRLKENVSPAGEATKPD